MAREYTCVGNYWSERGLECYGHGSTLFPGNGLSCRRFSVRGCCGYATVASCVREFMYCNRFRCNGDVCQVSVKSKRGDLSSVEDATAKQPRRISKIKRRRPVPAARCDPISLDCLAVPGDVKHNCALTEGFKSGAISMCTDDLSFLKWGDNMSRSVGSRSSRSWTLSSLSSKSDDLEFERQTELLFLSSFEVVPTMGKDIVIVLKDGELSNFIGVKRVNGTSVCLGYLPSQTV
ncbi:hypothetical protein T10_10330 [Trichinella papuae]|uniref:Uncharacterized protein n=1 Tax=Trichinella papuae TaxID=268474 RepID=A0A0V1M0A1_9BILA|nr:hypothetical protein T10_10330 [Trichinella papuae]